MNKPIKIENISESEKEALKHRIIADLFNSGEVQKKIHIYMFKNWLKMQHSHLEEDVLQETFMHLSNYPTDRFLSLYSQNPKYIVGLAVRIAQLKGFAEDPRLKYSPNHSLKTKLMYASSFKNPQVSASEQDYEEESFLDQGIILVEPEPSSEEELKEYIFNNLTEEEQLQFSSIAQLNKIELKKLTEQEKENNEMLFEKIRNLREGFNNQ